MRTGAARTLVFGAGMHAGRELIVVVSSTFRGLTTVICKCAEVSGAKSKVKLAYPLEESVDP